MFDGLFIISLVGAAYQIGKEICSKPVPAENWANKELYHRDIMNGVPIEQRMKNLESGKYKMNNAYPEPHRDHRNGKIIIENSQLYHKDVMEHGAYKAQQWAKQGRYNLSAVEMKKEKERIKNKYNYLYNL